MNITSLKIENISLIGNIVNYNNNSLHNLPRKLQYLDASYNNISQMYGIQELNNLIYLDLKFNMINSIDFNFNSLSKLEYISLNKSLTKYLTKFQFKFGNKLENAILSSNGLRIFPRFCEQDEDQQEIKSCNLKSLHFDHNQLNELKQNYFISLGKLEYLNLHSNNISQIDDISFINLESLETLILSNNNLNLANNTQALFNSLTNIKILNLSFNFIEFIQMNTFQNLLKLEAIDLSNNKIYTIKEDSFKGLVNLRDLYINGNEPSFKLENSSFNQFEAIKTIFIDKSVLNNSYHKSIFIEMVKNKNSIHNKTILKWSYFQAFNLITLNESLYDCHLVFEFIRFNIQYNLKTEADFSDYLANCQFNVFKRKDPIDINIQDYKQTINFLYLFFFMLTFIIFVALIFSLYLVLSNRNAIQNAFITGLKRLI